MIEHWATSISYANYNKEENRPFIFGSTAFVSYMSRCHSFRMTIHENIKPVSHDALFQRSIECIESLKKQKPVTREEALAQVKRNEEMLANDPMYKSMR